MADEEKALEASTGSLENDRASDKSCDDKAIEAGNENNDNRHGGFKKDEEAHPPLANFETGSGSSDQRNAVHTSDPDPNLVDWEGDNDPENPMHFSLKRKIWMSIMASFTTFGVSFSSSVFSADTAVTAEKFNVSEEVMILGVSLYVLGFACGIFKTPLTCSQGGD